jgi:hypothetical protein
MRPHRISCIGMTYLISTGLKLGHNCAAEPQSQAAPPSAHFTSRVRPELTALRNFTTEIVLVNRFLSCQHLRRHHVWPYSPLRTLRAVRESRGRGRSLPRVILDLADGSTSTSTRSFSALLKRMMMTSSSPSSRFLIRLDLMIALPTAVLQARAMKSTFCHQKAPTRPSPIHSRPPFSGKPSRIAPSICAARPTTKTGARNTFAW